MTESLFPQSNVDQTIDPSKDYLQELTGPGGKFDRTKYTNEADMYQAIARGKAEADLHISLKNRQFDTLTEDYKKLRTDYNASPKLQEVLDRILAAQTSSSETTLPKEDNNTAQDSFDPSKLDSMLEEKLNKIETLKKAQANWTTVREKLQERFGDKYPEMIATQTQKLGLTADKVEDLARTAPSAFFRMKGLDEQPKMDSFQSPPRSSQQTTNFAPNSNKRTWGYWKGQMKTQPGLFSDPKAHNQMMDDIKAIGEKAFYDVP